MNLIRLAIERPIAIVSGVLMIVLFGLVALRTIPIQLAPDVAKPVISVSTAWPGAAPAEVEREIVNRQEEVLKGLASLAGMESSSRRGSARVTLEFNIGTNMDKALLLVSNRLDRVGGYPEEVSQPTLSMAGNEDRPIAWFILQRLPGNTRPMHEYGDFFRNVLQERIERVEGISEVSGFGGSERELQVVVEPQLLARFRITPGEIITALRRANASFSAGKVDEGKRSYTVRAEGELNSIEAVRAVIVRSENQQDSNLIGRVSVGDIADVKFAYKEPTARIRQLGEPSLAFNAKRETGANVIKTMEGIRIALAELRAGPVKEQGLVLKQVYDETIYIVSAIELVRQNIWFGGSLAAILLLMFLRSWRATLIVSIAIPVSVIGSFVAMAALGRSINVISLAGLAFAVGMVVDAAIVVLENIYRLREQGKTRREAAYEGTKQVWGAVFVSALTTVMVFIPLLMMKLEVGQLFRDIAVAISVSVLLSLIVSVTVLPALSSKLLPAGKNGRLQRFSIPGLDHLARGFVAVVVGYVRTTLKSRILSLLIVVGISVATTMSALQFLPKLEYLPTGNRNLMFGVLVPPPGYNLKTMTGIATRFEDATRPLWTQTNPEPAKPGDPPRMRHFFFVALANRTFIGAAAEDPAKASQLRAPLQKLVSQEPGTFGIIAQSSLFGRGLGGGRQIDLDISGPDLNVILATASKAAREIFRVFPRSEGNGFRPVPGLELGAPEVRIKPNRTALADAGVTAFELGQSVDVFNDGLRVAEVTVDGERIDLRIKGPQDQITQTQGISVLPVITRNGEILPVSSLATVELTTGPTQIRHKERRRSVSLRITPRGGIPLETALETMQREVIGKLQKQGLPDGVTLRMSGTAEKLNTTWLAMQGQLIIAIILVYLVMAVLFESFVYPLIILLSVPLAAAGGVAGLTVLNMYYPQKLDMLTMLGFVILIGIVVNNAILLVHQTLVHIRQDGLPAADAIIEATKNRIRPIFMSTLTSVFGMLPLVMLPGAGSELYRGLGSVVVGGLSVSALLTLLVIPPMLAIFVGPLENRRKRLAT
ncbi:RND multidrug efflux transporter; Acriflavin resistance protein [hydrothermal vent metagenome]|uniref:RND multidrug efflux transporter Acriflavin resistance protein n=1 Tax=hydrothermal vent metagenome TaxID=652676 RepID=A0A3B0RGQ5_9ZZZZ